jgi:hypothetical protein
MRRTRVPPCVFTTPFPQLPAEPLLLLLLLLLLCRQVDLGCHAAAVFQRRLQIWSGRSILVCRRYEQLWVLPCLFTLMILLIGDPACDVLHHQQRLLRIAC